MPVRALCACGAEYNLKDEYSGMTLGCPKCGGTVCAPNLPPPPPVRSQEGDLVFSRDVFLMNEDHFSFDECYYVTDKEGKPLMYVERPVHVLMNLLALAAGATAGIMHFLFIAMVYALAKKAGLPRPAIMAIGLWGYLGSFLAMVTAAMAVRKRRNVTVYADDEYSGVLLTVTQDYRFPLLTAAYTVRDAFGLPIARIFKKRLRNVFRKRWYGFSGRGEFLFMAREDSMILSVLRRFMLGFFGLMHTNFVIYGRNGVLGEFNRRMTLQDRYVLDLSQDALRALDRRVGVALGVLLDTGEGR